MASRKQSVTTETQNHREENLNEMLDSFCLCVSVVTLPSFGGGTTHCLRDWVYDALAIWREYRANEVAGGPVTSGDYIAEEAPAELLNAFKEFF